MPMRRTSILLDPGLLAEVERIARRQGRPTSHVIREALEQYVKAQRELTRELPGFVGIGRGPGIGEPGEPQGSTESPRTTDTDAEPDPDRTA